MTARALADARRSAPSATSALSRRLAAAFEAVEHGQHPNGEMLSFRRDEHGDYTYVRSPFVSTFVHEALACFDRDSPRWLEGSVELFPAALQARVLRTVAEMRRRMRAFLIWQQEPFGTWRFFGLGSGIDPDVNSTVCGLAALREGHGVQSLARWELGQAAVLAFRSSEGPFFTFLKPGRGGYGWLSATGVPVVGFDRVVNAEVLRFLCATDPASRATASLAGWVVEQLRSGEAEAGSPLYPSPVCFAFVVARALEEAEVPLRADLAAAALALATRLQHEDGGFGGALATAMGATALLGLGAERAALDAARRAVLRACEPGGAWPYEDFVVHGFGAPAWTTALSLAFLARHRAAASGAPG
jgi:hypothetical protein